MINKPDCSRIKIVEFFEIIANFLEFAHIRGKGFNEFANRAFYHHGHHRIEFALEKQLNFALGI